MSRMRQAPWICGSLPRPLRQCFFSQPGSLIGRWGELVCSDRCRGGSLWRPTPRSRHPSGRRRSTGRVSPGDQHQHQRQHQHQHQTHNQDENTPPNINDALAAGRLRADPEHHAAGRVAGRHRESPPRHVQPVCRRCLLPPGWSSLIFLPSSLNTFGLLFLPQQMVPAVTQAPALTTSLEQQQQQQPQQLPQSLVAGKQQPRLTHQRSQGQPLEEMWKQVFIQKS